MSATAGSAAPRGSLSNVLRIAFAAALLALVAYNVPWRDRLAFHVQGASFEVPGEIHGDWRSERVHFRFAKDAELESEWPLEARTAFATGTALPAMRSDLVVARDSPQGAFEWRPGMIRIFREVDPRYLGIATLMFLVGAAIGITRWWRLLSVAGCPASWLTTLRLTFLGMFFNLILPGLTGGDLVKAVLVVRENPERRADALMSVIVDRGLGLVVLIGIAAFVTCVAGEHFAELRLPVVATFAGVLLGIFVYMHPATRRVLRIERILERLPHKERFKSLDRALRIYSSHPLEMLFATLLSIANHATLAYGIFALGRAFGDSLTYLDYLGVASIANTISSVPIAPAGWGVGEAAYGYLFHLLGAAATLGIAVSVSYRLLTMALGLVGGLFLLLPSGKRVRAEIEAGAAER